MAIIQKYFIKGGKKMKIYIASDHRGVELENNLIDKLIELGYTVEKSLLENNPLDDYPDFAFDIAKKVVNDKSSIGIIICGNGIGVSIAANKVKGIRCARVVKKEEAYQARNHNGANMLAFGGISVEDALLIVKTFIETPYVNEEKHLRRVEKIISYENGAYYE